MNLGCTFAGHDPDRGQVYNAGYYFSACRRCGDHLVRTARSGWGRAPRGHRIVWKVGRGSHSLEADYGGVLPIMLEGPPAPPRRKTPASRALIRVQQRPAAAAALGAVEEGDDYKYPRLLLAAAIVGAGLRLLFGFASGR
jgi:hypothetical protein